jgi:hypothetical protein
VVSDFWVGGFPLGLNVRLGGSRGRISGWKFQDWEFIVMVTGCRVKGSGCEISINRFALSL